jgi:hypothetical protein
MHRSGTSVVTRLINLMGVETSVGGDVIERAPWNPKGHWESRALIAVDDRLLASGGFAWWYPPPDEPDYPEAMRSVWSLTGWAGRAFDGVHQATPWVWKDPRASLLVPFWRAVLGDVAVVIVSRHPSHVAESLNRRNRIPMDRGLALWERYNRLILRHCAGLPVLVAAFEEVVAEPFGWMVALSEFLAAVGIPFRQADAAAVHTFVDQPVLRRAIPTVSEEGLGARVLLETLSLRRGAHPEFEPVDLPVEPARVAALLAEGSPTVEPEWMRPPSRSAVAPFQRR